MPELIVYTVDNFEIKYVEVVIFANKDATPVYAKMSVLSCRDELEWNMSYIEEDLSNKSEILLKCNPVHEKIAVLVHGGRAIAEENVGTGNQSTRFVGIFGGKDLTQIYTKSGFSATKEAKEVLRVIEEDALEGENKFFNGNTIGLIDIAFGWLAGWLPIFEEVNGLKLLDHNSFPNIRVWIENFKKDTVIKENLPSCDEMLPYYMRQREKFVASASQYLHYRHSFVFVHFKGMARQFLV
ncbi:hypothetical protein LguiB_000439 [Lonicera macranthoides]